MDRRIQENLSGKTSSYTAPFLWLMDENSADIVSTLDDIRSAGVRAICLESRTHSEFCRDGWWKDLDVIFAECEKRDMKVWILDDKHFPTGYANGIFEEKHKDLRPWCVTERHVDVCGPIRDGAIMVDAWKTRDDDEIVGVVACKHIPSDEKLTGEPINLTANVKNGMCYFDLPSGTWRIVIMIKTRSGYANYVKNFMDLTNPVCTDLFIEEIYQSHYDRYSRYFGNVFLGFFSDEPGFYNDSANGVKHSSHLSMGICEAHYPYPSGMIDFLSKKIGKDAITLLAGLWFDFDNEISSTIRYEYMDKLTLLYKENFCDKIGRWCSDHGVKYIGHIIEDNDAHYKTNASAGHYFRALEGQHMSGIDVVLHQIVPGLTETANRGYPSYQHMKEEFYHYYLAKLGASLAHLDLDKKGRAMCEIFGAYGWAESYKIMKYLCDHMLVRGINYFVPHAFSLKSDNPDCPPTFSDPNNPEFKYFDKLISHLDRTSHILSDGVHVPCCAILYDAEAHWINGKQIDLEKIAKKLYDAMLDYDVVPFDYLDKMDENGNINGETFKVLIVPYAEKLPSKILDKLRVLKTKVVVCANNESEKIDGFDTVLLSKVVSFVESNSFRDVLEENGCKFLRYYHYKRNGADYYMFHNEDVTTVANARLTVSAFNGGSYIEYDPFENRAVRKYSKDGKINLTLCPYHSVILAFNELSYDGVEDSQEKTVISEKALDITFDVSVKSTQDAHYRLLKTTNELFNITGREGDAFFVGEVLYEGSFALSDDDKNYILDLGYVGEIAKVCLNGKEVCVKTLPPYCFDLKGAIKKGENHLQITTTSHSGYNKRDTFSKFLAFEPTGILGPISLKKYEEK